MDVTTIWMMQHPLLNQIVWAFLWVVGLFLIIAIVITFQLLIKSSRKPIQNGFDVLLGAKGRTIVPIALHGQAVIRGEIWEVFSKHPIPNNTNIQVIQVDGLRLEVKAIKGD